MSDRKIVFILVPLLLLLVLIILILAIRTTGSIGLLDAGEEDLAGRAGVAGAEDNSYVGASACFNCHVEESAAWNRSRHKTMLQDPGIENMDGKWDTELSFNDPELGRIYIRLEQNGSDFDVVLVNKDDPNGSIKLDVEYIIGGGAWRQRMLVKVGNSRYVIPLQWNIDGSSWSPVFEDEWFRNEPGSPNATPKLPAKDRSWDRRCGGCHTTGYEVEFSETTKEYIGKWEENGISCEACHGPGKNHVESSKKKDYGNIELSLAPELCGSCHVKATDVSGTYEFPVGFDVSDHESLEYNDDPNMWPDGNHSKGNNQQYQDWQKSKHFAALDNLKRLPFAQDSCLDCHSSENYLANKKNDPQRWPKKNLSTAETSITCNVCHDPHGSPEPKQLRKDPYTICVGCHTSEGAYPSEAVHHPQREVRMGEQYMSNVRCPDCHMPKTVTVDEAGIEYDSGWIRSHTFQPITPSVTEEFDTPNSCTSSCHNGKGPGEEVTNTELGDWIEAVQTDTAHDLEGLTERLEELEHVLENVTEGNIRTSPQTYARANAKYVSAEYNLELITEDKSQGVHNPPYVKELMNSSFENVSIAIALLAPPERVNGLMISELTGNRIQIKWNKVDDADLAGYNIYISQFPLENVSSLEHDHFIEAGDDVLVLETWDMDGEYYAAVTSVDQRGNEYISALEFESFETSSDAEEENGLWQDTYIFYIVGIVLFLIILVVIFVFIRKDEARSGKEKDPSSGTEPEMKVDESRTGEKASGKKGSKGKRSGGKKKGSGGGKK